MALKKEILDVGPFQIEHYFLCAYVPVKAGKDELSRSVLRFKNKLEVDLTAWVECSTEVLSPLLSSSTAIVRALSHDEKMATFSPLDRIGLRLSEKMNCQYLPMHVRKRSPSPPLKKLNRADRINALRELYYCEQNVGTEVQDFLILDDILTTGTTAAAIANAIRDRFHSGRITLFTLAKVDYDLHMSDQEYFEGEHFRWQENAWMGKGRRNGLQPTSMT